MTFFFYGSNGYLMRRQVNQMVEAFIKKTGSDLGLERIDGAVAKPADIRAALQASPFLSSSRLVIIQGLAANKTAAEKLGDVLALVPKTTVAVFVEREVDQRTSAFKLLIRADKVVKFEPQTPAQLALWAQREIQGRGGTVERGAVQELLRLAGEDQWRLSEEITKLVSYDSAVTIQTVQLLVVPSIDENVFALLEAITAGQLAVALERYKGLVEAGKEQLYVLSMITWQLRNLLLAKTAPAAMPAGELAKLAGMSPYVAGKMKSAHARFSEAALRAALLAAIDCELAIKTGNVEAERGVEQLVYELTKRRD